MRPPPPGENHAHRGGALEERKGVSFNLLDKKSSLYSPTHGSCERIVYREFTQPGWPGKNKKLNRIYFGRKIRNYKRLLISQLNFPKCERACTSMNISTSAFIYGM
jgi:hypothetical protein